MEDSSVKERIDKGLKEYLDHLLEYKNKKEKSKKKSSEVKKVKKANYPLYDSKSNKKGKYIII